jgi:poly-gamma-glutamate synthesis protein (capsule biosynthesis protein)
VLRGVEWYRARPVLYCAGDFIDDYAIDAVERNDESSIFCLEMDGRDVRRILAYPTIIRESQARLARGDDADRIALLLQRLCAGLRTSATWDATSASLTLDCPAPASHPESHSRT